MTDAEKIAAGDVEPLTKRYWKLWAMTLRPGLRGRLAQLVFKRFLARHGPLYDCPSCLRTYVGKHRHDADPAIREISKGVRP